MLTGALVNPLVFFSFPLVCILLKEARICAPSDFSVKAAGVGGDQCSELLTMQVSALGRKFCLSTPLIFLVVCLDSVCNVAARSFSTSLLSLLLRAGGNQILPGPEIHPNPAGARDSLVHCGCSDQSHPHLLHRLPQHSVACPVSDFLRIFCVLSADARIWLHSFPYGSGIVFSLYPSHIFVFWIW